MIPSTGFTRRRLLTLAAGTAAAMAFDTAAANDKPPTIPSPSSPSKLTQEGKTMLTRAIPSSDEPIPVVGLGTYRGFDVATSSPAYKQLRAVLDALFAAGGSVIDSSPMYGRAEQSTGELLSIHEPR